MNTTRAILLDADGVMLKKQRYFSEIFSEQYGVPTELIIPFFKTKFGDCQKGITDLKNELVPFLKKWKWNGSVQDFLDYWFSSCTEIDAEILKIVQEMRENGIKCYLATDQERHRGEYIKNNLGLDKHLDGFFYSYEIGHTKSEAEFFRIILEKLNFKPDEVVFCDDEEENILAAKRLGVPAIRVNKADDFKKLNCSK